MADLELLKKGQLMGQKALKISAGLSEFPLEILDLADSLELLVLSDNCLSRLPDEFGQLKKLKVVFFNNNAFETFPAVLAECPALSMISFKRNRINAIDEQILSTAIRWLILTDNQLETLPADIGKLSKLQKLMLAGNRLRSLPAEMAACQNLELIRLSANQLSEIPGWLFSLPRLSWLAYAGNPCGDTHQAIAQRTALEKSLPTIDSAELLHGDILGQGASGVIYKSLWTAANSKVSEVSEASEASEVSEVSEASEPKSEPVCPSQEVAVKLFKGEITSDGLPLDEMRACMAAGAHPNLVTVLGKLKDPNQAGLVFSFISPEYHNLGEPPSLESCTRDIYDAEISFTLPVVLRIAQGIASAVAQLHANGIMHGDLYAHNILINEQGKSILGDFGAASFYDPQDAAMGKAPERLEARAFGCLLEDLLDRCAIADGDEPCKVAFEKLRRLQESCMSLYPPNRPLFADIYADICGVSADVGVDIG